MSDAFTKIPMPKQVSGLNTAWVISYLQKYHPHINLIDLINDTNINNDFYVANIKTGSIEPVSLEHISNIDNWFSNKFMMAFYRAISIKVPEKGLGFKIGKTSNQYKKFRRATIFAPLIGPNQLISRVIHESKKFNRTKTTQILEKSKNHTKIRLIHDDGIIINDFAMDWHAGVFFAYAKLTGVRDLSITWESKDEQYKVVDFLITFKNPGIFHRITKTIIFNIPLVRKALETADIIQEEHRKTILNQEKIIEERTKQIQTMQKQLIEQERIMTEKHIAGGMAHEIRNALGAAKLRLTDKQTIRRISQNDRSLLDILHLSKQLSNFDNHHKEVLIRTLRELSDNNKAFNRSFDEIAIAVERGLSVANRVMDYAKLNRPFAFDVIDIKDSLDKVIDIYRENFYASGISFQMNIEESLTIRGSSSQLHAVFQNLILNARDAIVESKRNDGLITINAFQNKKSIIIEITDNGCGIPEDNIEKIFFPFFSTKPSKGLGLGLSECQKIVSAQKGQIKATSSIGVGSTFKIIFGVASTV